MFKDEHVADDYSARAGADGSDQSGVSAARTYGQLYRLVALYFGRAVREGA